MGNLFLVCFKISSKTLKNRNLKKSCIKKFCNYASICPESLDFSLDIYAKNLISFAKSQEKYLDFKKKWYIIFL